MADTTRPLGESEAFPIVALAWAKTVGLIEPNGTIGFLRAGNSLSELTNRQGARLNLGLTIGTDVQAYSSVLTKYAGGATPSDFALSMMTKTTPQEWAATMSVGTVTSVTASGGTTGLIFTGGSITTSGTVTLGGVLNVESGGTGTNSLPDLKNLLGIDQINNTADADKPISTAAAAAIASKFNAPTGTTDQYVRGDGSLAVLPLIPDNLGTVTSVGFSGGTTGLVVSGGPISTIGTFVLSGVLAVANGGTGVTSLQALKDNLALDQVNNTPDSGKPVSTAQQAALNRKVAIPSGAPDNITLPLPEANKPIGWNPTGSGLVNMDPPATEIPNADQIQAGAFTGTTIGEDKDVHEALQALETAVEAGGNGGVEPSQPVVDIFEYDGTTKTFDLSKNPGLLNNIQMAIGGVVQTPGDDFTWDGDLQITVVGEIYASEKIVVRYYESVVLADLSADQIVTTDGGSVQQALQAIEADLATKASTSPATISSPGLMSISDKIKATGVVYLPSLGAYGDGSHDDSDRIRDAQSELGVKGGVIDFGHGRNYVLADPPQVSQGVHWKGRGWPFKPRNYWDLRLISPTSITVPSDKTIYIQAGGSVTNMLAWMANISVPTTESAFYTELAKFSGMLFSLIGDDASVRNCLGIGFNKFAFADNVFRPVLTGNIFDCNSGIELTRIYDFRNVEVCGNLGQGFLNQYRPWPWATTRRPGKAFHVHDGADFIDLLNNKSYGYACGVHLKDVSSCNVSGKFDGPSLHDATAGSGTRGVWLQGNISNSKIDGVHVDGQDFGYVFDTDSHPVQMGINSVGHCTSNHILFGDNSCGDLGRMQLSGAPGTPLSFSSNVGYWSGEITSTADASSNNMCYLGGPNVNNKIRKLRRTQIGKNLIDPYGYTWTSTVAGLADYPNVRQGDRAIVTDSTTVTYGQTVSSSTVPGGGGNLTAFVAYLNGAWIVN